MRTRTRVAVLEWLSIGSLILSAALVVGQLVAYSRARSRMPPGLRIADVPVGGLAATGALQQIATAYAAPIELLYRDQRIILVPSAISFRLDAETMLAAAEAYRTEVAFWPGFWDYLWQRPGQAQSVELKAEYSQTQLQAFLDDVALRYDEPPTAAQPIPGTLSFEPGSPGYSLDKEAALERIEQTLLRPQNRRVELPVSQGDESRPTLETLGALLRQQVDLHGFPGLVSIMVVDAETGKELHMNYQAGQLLPTEPDVAYAAMSTLKTAIMVEFYRQLDRGAFPRESELVEKMIRESSNYAPNALLDWAGDGNRTLGLQRLNETLSALGLANTFMTGWYEQESAPAPLTTPANSRTDVTTLPDPAMQTTASDMATLYLDLYQCQNGGGALLAVFDGQITPDECRRMLEYLSQNTIGVLIEAGVPEGTRVAHKHGWITDSFGDAGIVFSPGGDYVLSMYLYQEVALQWADASKLMSDLSRAVYNYFNAGPQI